LKAELVFVVDEVIPETGVKLTLSNTFKASSRNSALTRPTTSTRLTRLMSNCLKSGPWTTSDWRPHLPSPRIVSMQSTLSAGPRYLPLGGPRLL